MKTKDTITVDTDLITVSIKSNKHNDLLNLSINGSKTITDFKSLEALYSEYKESSHKGLDKLYTKSFTKAEDELIKATKAFEASTNKILAELTKDLGDL